MFAYIAKSHCLQFFVFFSGLACLNKCPVFGKADVSRALDFFTLGTDY